MHSCALFVAKNLILAGVKSVTLHDEGTVELWDLSSNFIFTEDDLGKNRALASILKMQELNNSVVISTLTTELTTEQLSEFQVIIISMLILLNFVIHSKRDISTLSTQLYFCWAFLVKPCLQVAPSKLYIMHFILLHGISSCMLLVQRY